MEKKCKVCGAPAEWEFDNEFYCENCIRTDFGVLRSHAPRICDMCGWRLDDLYYTDCEGYTFCSTKCALEYNNAKKLEEEGDDDE